MQRNVSLAVATLTATLGLARASHAQGSAFVPALPDPPVPALLFPDDGAILDDVELLLAVDLAASLLDPVILTVFQASPDGLNWQDLGQQDALPGGTLQSNDFQPGFFDFAVDPQDLALGQNALRCLMLSASGQVFASDPVFVFRNQKPFGAATAQDDFGNPGLVHFDAAASQDLDGIIVDYHWDFGDGNETNDPQPSHLYADTNQDYQVILTVTDDQGSQKSEHYQVTFSPFDFLPLPVHCVCTGIELRGDGAGETAALGADARAGGSSWPVWQVWDGKTLGPLKNSTRNPKRGGERRGSGYAFEIVATVDGNPALCPEIQVTRGRVVNAGLKKKRDCERAGGSWVGGQCEFPKRWTGVTKYDRDLDGTTDLDVSTQAKCNAAGGTWDPLDGCTLGFPLTGSYGPDVDDDTKPQGAYQRPFTHKKYVGRKIIWADAPMFGGRPDSSRKDNDFVAIIKGTDGKFCYVKFELRVQKLAGEDTETLTETARGVGVAGVPGVP